MPRIIRRLTKRDEFGNADIIGVDMADLQCNLDFDEMNLVTNALNRLAEFEEISIEPARLILLCRETCRHCEFRNRNEYCTPCILSDIRKRAYPVCRRDKL